jgi:hypothetical protein
MWIGAPQPQPLARIFDLYSLIKSYLNAGITHQLHIVVIARRMQFATRIIGFVETPRVRMCTGYRIGKLTTISKDPSRLRVGAAKVVGGQSLIRPDYSQRPHDHAQQQESGAAVDARVRRYDGCR